MHFKVVFEEDEEVGGYVINFVLAFRAVFPMEVRWKKLWKTSRKPYRPVWTPWQNKRCSHYI